jgi:hypothetical protein
MKPYTFCRKSLVIILSITSIVAFTSCQKDIPKILKEIDFKPGKPVVFVAGFESNGENNVAKCWIDGQELTLSDGTNDASANSIVVTDDDFYIAGYDAGPVYWKNNKEIRLPLKSKTEFAKTISSANSVYVSGNKVYIAGKDSTRAVYWIDGKEIFLSTTDAMGNFPYSYTSSVFVSGNDIYVAGTHGYNAVYWKNGVEVYLTANKLSGYGGETTSSIYVSGGNVYIIGSAFYVGQVFSIPRYWKNGIDQFETLNSSNFDYFRANSVFQFGNNVYISGDGFNSFTPSITSALYWNNSNETILSSDNINSFNTNSIYVKRNDVYISGYEESNNQLFAVYWKNGVKVKLTDGTRDAFASSIFVK